jgi:hypothetical protein
MALFRSEDAPSGSLRCPECRERLPDGATECTMCGAAVEPRRQAGDGERSDERPADDQAARR